MPINTSFAGNIPWLDTTTTGQASSAGTASGVALANVAMQAAQEKRLRQAANRIAQRELARQLGMNAVVDEVNLFKKANPKATEEQINQVSKNALFQHAPQIFAETPEVLLRSIGDDTANRIREEANKALAEQRDIGNLLRSENQSLNQALRLKGIIDDKDYRQENLRLTEERDKSNEAIRQAELRLKQREQLMKETDSALGFDTSLPATEEIIERQLRDEESLAASKGIKWTDEQRTERRAELRTLKNFKSGPSGSFEVGPDGTVSLKFGDAATVGTQTKIQTELAGLQNSVTQIRSASANLREKDVGVAGTVWDTLMNKWVSQAVPSAGDPSVAGNRVRVQQAVESYLESQQARGRLSAPERANMRKALVGLGPGESLPRGQDVLNTMAKLQQLQAIALAKSAQQPLKAWMFNGMGDKDFKIFVQSGDLTTEEASEWYFKTLK